MLRQRPYPTATTSADVDRSTMLEAAGAERQHSRSLRSKIVLALALMLGVVVGIEEFVRRYVIATEFAALERVTALKETNRVLSAINTEIDYLSEMASRDINFGAYFPGVGFNNSDATTRMQWRATIDDHGNWNWLTNDDTDALGLERITARLQQHGWDDSPSATGISTDNDGNLVLFAGLKLPTVLNAGHGNELYYAVGRPFDALLITELQRRTSVPFTINRHPIDEPHDGKLYVQPVNQSMLAVHSPLLNPKGETLAELVVHLPRDVMMRSKRTTAIARYLSMCGVCGSLLMLFLLLQRLVIGRLEMIRQHTEQIAQSGVIVQHSDCEVLEIAGNDEIGQLAESFARMRDRLGDAQRQLSDASHAAGMSLVADTVIHNVGNVLTNVNSLMETATKRVTHLRIEPLERLASRLEFDDADEAFRKATPKYLHRLSETLEEDKQDLVSLLHTLNDNIQHIHQVIGDQRKHTNQSVNWNLLSLNRLVEEAIACVEAKLHEDNVEVELKLDSNVLVWSDRSMLLQVLINIIANAGNASCGLEPVGRRPLLRVDIITTKSAARVRFRDNGCGMDKATLERVFDAHFTTREAGTGLGLHFCANTLKRLGGSIEAYSEGPNLGATFIVELPLTKPTAKPHDEGNRSSEAFRPTPDDTVKLHPATSSGDSGDSHD
ncbi:ATP-binding protein [Rhodopirellula sp. MGV]|uniref:sensor histidine kinase n=1 Tax=Rhodopirellula sp. MGV TaxID=2023130 RepID=UPI000B97469A|nr:ATP-binding protein [Rhodopirellula sp. MGV]OYP31048.1 hypothetical protein CGZ80_22005 [Rhodopirellula sp. MGV]PNY34605.1 HAMP domain-containing protein [Rhodopirellula baltica]